MKVNYFKYSALILLFSSFFFTSCSDRNDSFGSVKSLKTDSISKCYQNAKDKLKPLPERIASINTSYTLSKNASIDSLEQKSLSYKIILHNKAKQYDSVLFYGRKLMVKALSTNDTVMLAKANFKIGNYFYKTSRTDSAFFYLNRSKNYHLSIKEYTKAGKRLLTMATLQNNKGDFIGSEVTAIEALEYLNPETDKKQIASVYNTLAISSNRQNNYDEAIYWYNKAISETKNQTHKLIYKNNLAIVYSKNNNFEKAINLLSKLAIDTLTINRKEKARIYDNLAYIKWLDNKNYRAEDELNRNLKIRLSENDFSGQFASYVHLIEYHKNLKQDKIAIKYAHNAYEIAKKINGAKSKVEALSYLIQLEDNPKKVANEYRRLTDSLTDARGMAKNQFAKVKYDTEKNRERVLELKAETVEKDLKLTKETSRRNILILVSTTLLIIVISIVLIWKQRIKTARIEERHDTNSRLSKKLHDEVGNDLYYLLLQLQKVSGFKNDQGNLKILKGFDTVYHKIRDFSRDNKVETGEEYGDELLSLLDSYGDDETKVITSELEANFWTAVSPLKKEELYWVLKELLTNMKRHSRASIAAVTFTKEKEKITVNYTDNGVGMNTKKIISKNGLRNVENRIKDISGTITFDSKPKEGFKATIVFKP
ncbi:tetratricopeptide repeat-containing sensor histidine kinase [Aquimarina sp. 2304DJ70-9]|uniref:tetratricopeptide repeat-containing sensor histidine kinase n=1 Tax=Aquimarina penaris TaxID=3231044 RepID=UPI00346206ED